MASDEGWDHEKMLQLYLYDYMVKRRMYRAAEVFKNEANIPHPHFFALNSREGFLYEWWSVFCASFIHNHIGSQEDKEEAFLQAMQVEEIKQQVKDHPMVPQNVATDQQIQSPEVQSSMANNDVDNIQFLPPDDHDTSNDDDIEGQNLRQSAMDFDPITLFPNNVNQPNLSYSSVPTSPIHIPPPPMLEQAQVAGNGISLGRASSPMDPLPNNVFLNERLPITGNHDEGMDQGVNPVSLNGWLVNGPNSNQHFQVPAKESQQPLSPQLQPCTPGKQTFGPGTVIPSSNPRSSSPMLTMSETRGKDKLMMGHFTKNAEQKSQCDQPQQRQLFNNGGNKQGALSLRAREIPADGMKGKEDGFGVEKLCSFISVDSNNAKNPDSPFSEPKYDSAGCAENQNKGFSFKEVGCHQSSKSELLCCHFSSDGKLLASAGVEQKVFIWNIETSCHFNSFERHRDPITDICFQPGTNTIATSSLDNTLKIWDAARPKKSHYCLHGHGEQVMSLDFHPRNNNLLCSCDYDGEIKYWDLIDSPTCIHTFKGAKKQVRFQPQYGKLLATASGNVVNLFDVETKTSLLSSKGHVKDILSVCWDKSGKYLLSVSEESVRLWSVMAGGKCIREFHASNGKRFHSCTFHPGYEHLWIIGGLQLLELWNPECRGSMLIPGHNGLVAALAQSDRTSMVASVGHDCSVKLWK